MHFETQSWQSYMDKTLQFFENIARGFNHGNTMILRNLYFMSVPVVETMGYILN